MLLSLRLAPSSRGPGHSPFTAATRVRIPSGSFFLALSHGPSSVADTFSGNCSTAAGVTVCSRFPKSVLGRRTPSNSYGHRPRRLPVCRRRQFQYKRLRSSIPGVIFRCRPCCIRSTLLMPSTTLDARTVVHSTRDTRSYDACSAAVSSPSRTFASSNACTGASVVGGGSVGRGAWCRNRHRRTHACRQAPLPHCESRKESIV